MAATSQITGAMAGLDLHELHAVLTAQQAHKVDVVVPAGKLEFNPDGTATIHDDLIAETGVHAGPVRFDLASTFDATACARWGIPRRYVGKMRAEGLDALAATNFNAWLAHDQARVLARTFVGLPGDDGAPTRNLMRGVFSSSYFALDNLDGVLAVLGGLAEAGVDPTGVIIRGSVTDAQVSLRVQVPEVEVHAPELLAGYVNPYRGMGRIGHESTGDTPPVVWGGFEFRNSEVGKGAWRIIPRLEVLACRNGLVINADARKEVHAGARLDEGQVQWSDATRARNVELIRSMAADAIRTFLTPEYVQAKVDEFTAEAARPLAAPAQEVLEVVTRKMAFSQREGEDLVRLFYQGGQVDRAGGVLQAVTALANVVADPDRSCELEDRAFEAMRVAAGVGR